MNKIIDEIERLRGTGYSTIQLEVDYGQPNSKFDDEGYYIAEIVKGGVVPITNVLVSYKEVDSSQLIKALDEIGIAYWF